MRCETHWEPLCDLDPIPGDSTLQGNYVPLTAKAEGRKDELEQSSGTTKPAPLMPRRRQRRRWLRTKPDEAAPQSRPWITLDGPRLDPLAGQ